MKKVIIAFTLLLHIITLSAQSTGIGNLKLLEGRSYYLSNDFDKALETYDTFDMNIMDERDLSNYAMSAFFKQKYDKSLEVTRFGLSKFPRHAAFNRLAFFNYTDTKQYDQALVYADSLFNKSDSAKISYYDYVYYGKALNGAGHPDKAIGMYGLALKQGDTESKVMRATILQYLSEAYKTYTSQATSHTDQTTMDPVLLQADSIYHQLGDNSKEDDGVVAFVYLMRARINHQLDPDQSKGLSKPFYEKLVELIAPKADLDNTDKSRLKEGYHYLISYHFTQKNDKATAQEYARKMLAIDPDNQIAKQVMGMK